MAIPDILAARIIEYVIQNDLSGHVAMLGRQRWIGKRRKRSAAMFEQTLETYLPGVLEEDLRNPDDEYSETFWSKLGFDQVDSIDVSDFEDASIVMDLGGAMRPELEARFDVIYDGGTCEHIFDLPTAYRNIHKMLKPGGVLIGHSPCNNWVNHGFYQICPEMVFGYWQKTMGYDVINCQLQPLMPMFTDRAVTPTNPNETGARPRISSKLPSGGIILDYAVRKPIQEVDTSGQVYQTDYEAKWSATT